MKSPQIPPIRCVIFDCDGVLVDSELIAARVASECFAEIGIAVSLADMVTRFAGVAGQKVTDILAAENGITSTPAITETRRLRITAALEREVRAIAGVAAALAAIRQPKCVASSSHPDRIRTSLGVAGIRAPFGDNIFDAGQVKRGKPAPDLFLYAAERMGFAPAECLVVEDSPFGVQAGRAAAMTVVGFVGGSHCGPGHPDLLARSGADIVIRRMSELPALVG